MNQAQKTTSANPSTGSGQSEEELGLNASELDKILNLRYESYTEIVDVDEPTTKLVIFEIHGEWFAFPGENIREILPQTAIFFVPGCPASLEGVINVRGDIESVIRLTELLGKSPNPSPSKQASSILLGQGSGMHSGIRVDRVVDVLDAVNSAIQAPPTTLTESMQRIVSGVMRHQERPVVILDLNHIFADYLHGLG